MMDKDFEFNELVKVENNQVVVDSREVAKNFGKLHKHVLSTIDEFMETVKDENSSLTQMFKETSYKAGTGKSYRMFWINRDGFTLLVMGFTGKKAIEWKLKYISAFNWMEEQLKKQLTQPNISDLIADPDLLIGLATKIKEQKKQIEVLTPKAEYTDHILDSKLLVNTTSIAKDFGMSAVTFNKLLKHFKIIYRHNNRGQWFVYQEYIDKGYAQSCTFTKTLDDGTTKEGIYTKWTQAGKEFLCGLLKEHKFIPVVDWAEYPAFYAKELKNRLKELGVLK